MPKVDKTGENLHGHIYLYCKGHYKVNMSMVDALGRIFSEIYIFPTDCFKVNDILHHLLNMALDHCMNDRHKLIEMFLGCNPSNTFNFNLHGYKSYEDALLRKCISIISCTKVTDIKGTLPKPDVFKFFTTQEVQTQQQVDM